MQVKGHETKYLAEEATPYKKSLRLILTIISGYVVGDFDYLYHGLYLEALYRPLEPKILIVYSWSLSYTIQLVSYNEKRIRDLKTYS